MSATKGKIIAVVGSIASGKSYLVRQLSEAYRLKIFLEGETGDFPEFLKNNLAQRTNYLQTELYFINKNIAAYADALEHRNRGEIVMLDTYWLSPLFFLEGTIADPNERQLLRGIIENVSRIFPSPDAIVFLDTPEKLLAERLVQRGRPFEKNALPIAIQVSREHRRYFSDPQNIRDSEIIIENTGQLDMHRLAKQLNLKPLKE